MAEPLDYTNKPLEKNRYGRRGKLLVVVMLAGAIGLALFAFVHRVRRLPYTTGPGITVQPATTHPAED